jgi:hypothetical protein
MSDQERIDEKADQILIEIGLDPEGPPEQFTFEAGRQFGERFGELLPLDQEVFDQVFRELVEGFASFFPRDADSETIEFQAYFLGPLLSKFLTGRGLTVPEMATLAGVTQQRAYRLHRKGLSILYDQSEPLARAGVNRRFSGRDDRKTHHVVDINGVARRPWPAPADLVQPFLLGAMEGVKVTLERDDVRAQLEPCFRRAFANQLSDPALAEVIDGLILALNRIAQGLRDTPPGQDGPILRMKAERGKAIEFQEMLAELSRQKPAILAMLEEAGRALLEEGPSPPQGTA